MGEFVRSTSISLRVSVAPLHQAQSSDKRKHDANVIPRVLPKRSSRSRTLAAAPGATGASGASIDLKKTGGSNKGGGCSHAESHNATLAMRARIASMQDKFGAELEFLVTEFSKMEVQLAPEVEKSNAVS